MAWNGGFGGDEEGRGLELSLGLPGYFSGSPTQAAGFFLLLSTPSLLLFFSLLTIVALCVGIVVSGLEKGSAGSTAAPAKGTNGFKAPRPAAAAPVIGWPPVRAFRRNLASSSSKPPPPRSHEPSSQRGNGSTATAKVVEAGGNKGLFVKINMDGIPIGRKVDLRAHAGYDTLSAAVDHLFRGLLAAQTSGRDQQVITGVLNGSGEYTLVYEDEEGDQMLVGDVPWE
nr:unnamed protein product [Digitaria exilis]